MGLGRVLPGVSQLPLKDWSTRSRVESLVHYARGLKVSGMRAKQLFSVWNQSADNEPHRDSRNNRRD